MKIKLYVLKWFRTLCLWHISSILNTTLWYIKNITNSFWIDSCCCRIKLQYSIVIYYTFRFFQTSKNQTGLLMFQFKYKCQYNDFEKNSCFVKLVVLYQCGFFKSLSYPLFSYSSLVAYIYSYVYVYVVITRCWDIHLCLTVRLLTRDWTNGQTQINMAPTNTNHFVKPYRIHTLMRISLYVKFNSCTIHRALPRIENAPKTVHIFHR